MKLLNEFRKFAITGNVVDMGVGIVIGAAFTSIVNSLVKDVFSPLLALFTTGINFSDWFITLRDGDRGGPYMTLLQAQADNAITLNIGLFLNALISFLIVAWVLFFLVRTINRVRQPDETSDTAEQLPTTKACPHCCSTISSKARKCPFCTADLND